MLYALLAYKIKLNIWDLQIVILIKIISQHEISVLDPGH